MADHLATGADDPGCRAVLGVDGLAPDLRAGDVEDAVHRDGEAADAALAEALRAGVRDGGVRYDAGAWAEFCCDFVVDARSLERYGHARVGNPRLD